VGLVSGEGAGDIQGVAKKVLRERNRHIMAEKINGHKKKATQ